MSIDLETSVAPETTLRPAPSRDELSREWLALQAQCEDYEKQGLRLKLAAVVLFFLGYLLAPDLSVSAVLTAIIWLQEGIWKTWQSRLEDRILALENTLTTGSGAAFQLYSQWQKERPSSFVLARNYVLNALRPTVAFPYVVLLGLDLWLLLAGQLEAATV